jgi:hypothetical protein
MAAELKTKDAFKDDFKYGLATSRTKKSTKSSQLSAYILIIKADFCYYIYSCLGNKYVG